MSNYWGIATGRVSFCPKLFWNNTRQGLLCFKPLGNHNLQGFALCQAIGEFQLAGYSFASGYWGISISRLLSCEVIGEVQLPASCFAVLLCIKLLGNYNLQGPVLP